MTSKIVGAENVFCIPCSREKPGFASKRPSTLFYVGKDGVCFVNLEIKSVKEWKLSKHREVQLSAAFS